ncbi:MAG: hypothetical protein HY909_17915 [Deltaproteobacteria bacterium]|nr:hypothetical protein [Deltaproteobacteria bacterium]
MAELPLRWVVVCEAVGDCDLATGLADRYALEPAHGLGDWIRDDLDTYRHWRGLTDQDRFMPWKWVAAVAKQRRLRVHGYKGPETLPSFEVLRVFRLIALSEEKLPAGLLLVRDTDADRTRRQEFTESVRELQALLDGRGAGMRLCLALPHPEAEAWLLAGFEPESAEEQEALEVVRRDLGYDPRLHADRMNPGVEVTAQGPVRSSTKRVLDALTAGDSDRRRRCWADAPFERLRARGGDAGLTDFFKDLDAQFLASLREAGGP